MTVNVHVCEFDQLVFDGYNNPAIRIDRKAWHDDLGGRPADLHLIDGRLVDEVEDASIFIFKSDVGLTCRKGITSSGHRFEVLGRGHEYDVMAAPGELDDLPELSEEKVAEILSRLGVVEDQCDFLTFRSADGEGQLPVNDLYELGFWLDYVARLSEAVIDRREPCYATGRQYTVPRKWFCTRGNAARAYARNTVYVENGELRFYWIQEAVSDEELVSCLGDAVLLDPQPVSGEVRVVCDHGVTDDAVWVPVEKELYKDGECIAVYFGKPPKPAEWKRRADPEQNLLNFVTAQLWSVEQYANEDFFGHLTRTAIILGQLCDACVADRDLLGDLILEAARHNQDCHFAEEVARRHIDYGIECSGQVEDVLDDENFLEGCVSSREFQLFTLPDYDATDPVAKFVMRGMVGLRTRRLPIADPSGPAGLVLDASDPHRIAEKYFEAAHTCEGSFILLRVNAEWLRWDGEHYVRLDESEDLRPFIWRFLSKSLKLKRQNDRWEEVPFKPSRANVSEVAEALRSVARRGVKIDALPAWRNGSGYPPVEEIVPLANGLLHVPTMKLFPHTPDFISTNVLPYAYDPKAECWEFERFLASTFDGDQESVECVQEWFGLNLTVDTRYQKMLAIIGPTRAGKGTLGRVLTNLLGEYNVAGPALSAFGQTFGLTRLIGRLAAVVSDARMDQSNRIVEENILRITGEDPIEIARKFEDPWYGKLTTRITILANELPSFKDASTALPKRMVVVRLTKKFLGREDHNLGEKLKAEAPGILIWALQGLKRLRERGRLLQPASGQVLADLMEESASPMSVFIRDYCRVGPGLSVGKDRLYMAYKQYLVQEAGFDKLPRKVGFGRQLCAAEASVVPGRHEVSGEDGKRRYLQIYGGITLNAEGERLIREWPDDLNDIVLS